MKLRAGAQEPRFQANHNLRVKFQAQRGTEDVLPSQAPAWQHVERTWLDLTAQYGYGEIRTPTFEDTQLFIRTSGETSDIVSKEMYRFKDRGDRDLTLKPEGTAPAMRAVVEHNLCPAGSVLRLAYVTPIFRYGRPQKGRLREGHQLGLELVGSSAPAADAEVLEIVDQFLNRVGVPGQVISVNSIGRSECRLKYRDAILHHLASWLADQSSEEREKAEKNPLRLLDTKDSSLKDALVGIPPITDYLEPESRSNFDELVARLEEASVNYKLDPGIVRGLDYYSEMVFEVESNLLGAQSSLCGGGRYDHLIGEIGGPPTPSVGVGIGIERILIALEAVGWTPQNLSPDVFLVSAGEGARVRALARELRDSGLRVELDIEERSMKSQMRQADKSGAKFAIVLGEAEVAAGVVQVKAMVDGSQVPAKLSEVSDWLCAHR
jgi:histidyl-tRNA synthetase